MEIIPGNGYVANKYMDKKHMERGPAKDQLQDRRSSVCSCGLVRQGPFRFSIVWLKKSAVKRSGPRPELRLRVVKGGGQGWKQRNPGVRHEVVWSFRGHLVYWFRIAKNVVTLFQVIILLATHYQGRGVVSILGLYEHGGSGKLWAAPDRCRVGSSIH